MEKKYNAFISYRHSEKDSLIASEIQTRLERFKIPKEIQKKSGVKRFERIFRDKEELPITSDLNENIEKALEESDHLIVICSERTSESIWVRKEIETFLKYHTKRSIFTVLVDGEPDKVIPDILLHDQVTRMMADGTVETREELIEPLSCDYRIGIKKARKIELPRLAASMLGCSYDELVQRRRQYLRRRNAMIISCASVMLAGIIIYLCWSLVQINKNYELAQANYRLAQENYDTAQENYLESLSNQSRYLAAESAVLLSNDDRVGATQLAMAALPGEGNDRPLTNEAVYALHNALGTYTVPGYTDISSVWKYSSGQKIQKYITSPDNSFVAVLDETGAVNVWNLSDHKLVRTFDPAVISGRDIAFTGDSNLIISAGKEIAMFDDSFEESKWSIEIEGEFDGTDALKISEGSDELVYTNYDEVSIISVSGGNIVESHNLAEEIEDFEIAYIQRACLDPSGRYLGVECADSEGYGVYIFDREEKNWVRGKDSSGFITSRAFDEDGIIVTSVDDMYSSSTAFGDTQSLSENMYIISKYSVSDGSLIWECSVPHTLVGYEAMIRVCSYGEEGEKKPCIASFFSNRCVLIDAASGDVLAVKELPSEYIDSYITASGNGIYSVLRDGRYVYISLVDPGKAVASYAYFSDHVNDSAFYRSNTGSTSFLIEYSSRDSLIEYSSNFYDRSFKQVEDMTPGVSIYDALAVGDNVLLFGDDMHLYCYNSTYNRTVWDILVDGSYYTAVSLLAYDGNEYAYLKNTNTDPDSDSFGPRFMRVRVSDGESEYLDGLPDYVPSDLACVGNDLWFTGFGDYGSPDRVYKYDLSSGDLDYTEVTGDFPDSVYGADIFVSPDEKTAILIDKKDDSPAAFLLDIKKGDCKLFDADYYKFAVWNESSSAFALGDVTGFSVYGVKGNRMFSVTSGENKLVSVYLSDKYVVSVDSFGYVSFYDYEGQLTGSCEILVMRNASFEETTFEACDDELIINSNTIGNIIDLKDHKPICEVTGYLAYQKDCGRFFVKTYSPSDNEVSAGYFVRKDVDTLISEGEQYLLEANISDEMKNRYGI